MSPGSAAQTSPGDGGRFPPLLPLWTDGRKQEAYAQAWTRLGAPDAPARSEALLLLSMEAEERDDFPTAIARAAEAAAAEPRFIHARLRQASTLRRTGRWQEALALAEQAVKAWPRQTIARVELAQCLMEAGRFPESQRQYLAAIRLTPDHAAAHMGLAEALLMAEDWMAGWREYTWRTHMPAVAKDQPKLPMPLWNGMRLPGQRLILIADQGYGDCIQFCRFIPRAAERVGEIVLAASAKLAALLGRFAGVAGCVDRWEKLPPAAAYARLSDLPLLLGGEERDVGAGPRYMPLEEERLERWRARVRRDAGDRLAVGLSWSGRTGHLHNRLRSMPLAALLPLAGLEGACFFSLQFDEQKAQLAAWPAGGAAAIDLSGELEGFDETAHAIAALDLVVTIDTATAHMAGAVGTPTWTLLRRIPDWRWLHGRADSPWYPAMRLFRQDESETWEPVVAEVRRELAAVLAGQRDRLLPPAR